MGGQILGYNTQALHLHASDITTNWEIMSGVKGFLAKFLFEKAQSCWNSLDLQDFEEIVALLIYGPNKLPKRKIVHQLQWWSKIVKRG